MAGGAHEERPARTKLRKARMAFSDFLIAEYGKTG